MAKYIEMEVALREIERRERLMVGDKTITVDALKRFLLNRPAADVAPVRHGQWVEYQIPPIICCSNCDWATGIEEKNFQYCPNCGVKMDGGPD